jgi:hypothetical protein
MDKIVLQILIGLMLIFVNACGIELADFSESPIQYRVVSLTDSVRRPLIKAQLDAAAQCTILANKIPKTVPQVEMSWDYFDAIRGSLLNKEQLIQDGYYTGSLPDGVLGLIKTTTDKIIPTAMALPDNNILVTFEDDVIIPIDVDLSFRFALKNTPSDWDMLFLGCFQGALSDPNGAVKSPFYPKDSAASEGFSNVLCAKEALIEIPGTPWVKLTGMCEPGTWAYALRADSAKKIQALLDAEKPFSKPIDTLYAGLFNKKINAYCLKPELIRPNYALPSFLR